MCVCVCTYYEYLLGTSCKYVVYTLNVCVYVCMYLYYVYNRLSDNTDQLLISV